MNGEADWKHRAACKGMGDLFFPDFDAPRQQIAQAKAICGGCPVRRQCLEFSLSLPDRWVTGIWGGVGDDGRRKLRRQRRRGEAA